MKIVFLNTWEAKQKEEIEKFIKEHAPSTDVFCLQEVSDVAKPFFEELLEEFEPFYVSRENTLGNPGDLDFFLGTYVKEENVDEVASAPVLEEIPGVGLGIYSKIELGGNIINICNIHGQSRPGDKLDSSERIAQSDALVELFTPLEGLKIIGGDFNLLPETESVKMFEEAGYRNLIKDFKIETTRNRLAWRKVDFGKQYFADYVFCTPNIKIKDFQVPQNEASDHLPMILEF